MESICDRLEQKADSVVPVSDLRKMVDFGRNYVDRQHHAKEEKILFVVMEQAGYSQDEEPLGTFLAEHTLGRIMVGAISDAIESCDRGDPDGREDLLINGRAVSALLSKHICCEEAHLFIEAEQKLSPSQLKELSQKFVAWDKQPEEIENKRRCLQIIDELEASLSGDN